MRMTFNISVPAEMHAYILEQCTCGSTVSEYIRSLIRREQQRRKDYAARPVVPPINRANDCIVFAQALDQVDKLKAILERVDTYDD